MEPALRGRPGWLKVTTGLVSDMPKPSRTGQPNRRSKPCRTSTGSEAPPEMHIRRVETSAPDGCWSSAAYMVGTPSKTVARSRATASRTAPGSNRGIRTREAPLRTAALMVQICPKMWNSGRQPTTTSSGVIRWISTPLTSVLCRRPAWVRTAPLGRPVVPEVYSRTAMSSPSASATPGSGSCPASASANAAGSTAVCRTPAAAAPLAPSPGVWCHSKSRTAPESARWNSASRVFRSGFIGTTTAPARRIP